MATIRRLGKGFLNFALLAALGALAWWGHQRGWSWQNMVPWWQQAAASNREDAWCDEHGVPESICIACRPELMPKKQLFGWCRIHGVQECLWEHPELAQLEDPPQVTDQQLQRVQQALRLRPRPVNNPTCKLHLRRIQFASAQAADRAGIDIGLVRTGEVVESIRASGTLQYEPQRTARLAPIVPGTIWQLARNVGDRVQTGEVVALVESMEVGKAKGELLRAVIQRDLRRKTVQRLQALQGVVPASRLEEAQTALAESEIQVVSALERLKNLNLPVDEEDLRQLDATQLRRRLPLLGIPAEIAARLDPQTVSANLIPVTSPLDGVITEYSGVTGETTDPSRPFVTIVDPSRLWLMMDVPLEEIRYVRLGQEVLFQPDGDDHQHPGHVVWIGTEADPETRTIKVRAELPNDDGHLRSGIFGTGRIVLRRDPQAILVPRQAVHWEGCCFVVFVRDRNYLQPGSFKVYHTRMVRPGVVQGDEQEILAGLFPGEVVAVAGSGALRSELLKGQLGAG